MPNEGIITGSIWLVGPTVCLALIAIYLITRRWLNNHYAQRVHNMFGGSVGSRVAGDEDGNPNASTRRRKKIKVEKPRPVMHEIWLDVRQWTKGGDVYPKGIQDLSALESLLPLAYMPDPPRFDTLIRMPSRAPIPTPSTPFDSIEFSPIECDSAELLIGTFSLSDEREEDVRSLYLLPTAEHP